MTGSTSCRMSRQLSRFQRGQKVDFAHGYRYQSSKLPSSRSSIQFPEAPNKEHYDLASYLAYTERKGLDVNTTAYVGTHYEYKIASTMEQYGFDLRRVGGASDLGIDLVGTWKVPSASELLRVLVQCKAASSQSTQVGPKHIRELEGAFVGAPPGWRGTGVVGLLVTQQPATKGIRDSLIRSKWPMAFVACSREGVVQQMLWNQRAEEEGLEGMGVSVRHPDPDTQAQQLVLTWQGKPWIVSPAVQ